MKLKAKALFLLFILVILTGSVSYPFNTFVKEHGKQGILFLTASGSTDRSETDSDSGDNSTSSSTPSPEEVSDQDSDSDSDSDSGDNSTSSPTPPETPPEKRNPIADAGPDVTVQSQTLTQLDGSNSNDPNASGDDVSPPLNYDWTQTAGPEVTLNNPNTANPDFVSPQVQEETPLTFQLIVSTDSARSDPDSVTVSVTPAVIPQTLIADAGPDVTVQSQTLTQLDGSNSDDPNASGDDVGPALNYDWTQTAGPEVTLNNPNTANPDFISPQVQEETPLTFQLIVSTDSARSDPDSVTVSVTPAVIPQTLIADAGPDVTVQSQTLTQLDGSNSDDPNASG
ncbi:MAG: REJ domain-containing protein, partial [Candidatus Nitrosocosmicus sp.]